MSIGTDARRRLVVKVSLLIYSSAKFPEDPMFKIPGPWKILGGECNKARDSTVLKAEPWADGGGFLWLLRALGTCLEVNFLVRLDHDKSLAFEQRLN